MAHDLHKAGRFTFTTTNHLSRFAIIAGAVKKERGMTKKGVPKATS